MVDAATAWLRLGGRAWFVAPKPPQSYARQSDRPSVLQLLASEQTRFCPTIVTWLAGATFEYGTTRHRAFTYAEAIEESIPPGVALVVSDAAAAWAGAAMLGTRNPMVGVLHSDEATYYGLARRHWRDLAAMVCVSQRIADRARARVSSLDFPVATIPCGIPLAEAARSSLNPECGKVRIAWVGRMEEVQKRVSDLPKIARVLLAEGLKFRMDLVGDGPERDRLVGELEGMSPKPEVDFHGWCHRDAVLDILRQADVFLLTSNFEGMSISVMEALAAGCAVVASHTSGIEDYARHELASGCLWTFPVGDVSRAAVCVREALRVPSADRRAQSRSFASAEFSIDRCVAAYGNLIVGLPRKDQGTSSKARWFRARLTALASRPIAELRNRRAAAGGA